MSLPSTNIITQAVVFHDHSHKLITDEQARYLFSEKVTQQGFANVPTLGYFTLSSVAKIISLEDFYEQYPQKRVEHINYKTWEPPVDNQTPEQKKQFAYRLREGTLRGLESYIHFNCGAHPETCGARSVAYDIKAGRSKQLERLTA